MDLNRETIQAVSIIIPVLFVLLIPATAYAASDKAAVVKAEWNRVICIAIKVLQFVAVGLAALVLIAAGLRYMSSADDTDARDGAKTIVMQTIGALVLVIVAVTVVNYLVTGTDISRFDMNVCSDILPPATTVTSVHWPTTTSGTTSTTGTGTSTTGTGTSTTGVSPTTTTTPFDICHDPANKYAIPNYNACRLACSVSSRQCKLDVDANGIYDIDQICGAGFQACCCSADPVAYATCC